MRGEDRQNKGDTWGEQLPGTRGFCQGRELHRAGSSTAAAAAVGVFVKSLLAHQPSSTAIFLRPR